MVFRLFASEVNRITMVSATKRTETDREEQTWTEIRLLCCCSGDDDDGCGDDNIDYYDISAKAEQHAANNRNPIKSRKLGFCLSAS